MDYKEFSKRYKKMQKSEIILIIGFSSSLMLYIFSLNGDNGIIGNVINTIFNNIYFIKYLIIIIPFEIAKEYYKQNFYRYIYKKIYFLKPPVIARICILIYRLIEIPIKKIKRRNEPVSVFKRAYEKRGRL